MRWLVKRGCVWVAALGISSGLAFLSGPAALANTSLEASGSNLTSVSFSMNVGAFTSTAQYVAQDMGFLAKEGIKANRVYSNSCTTTFGLLFSGKLDFGACGLSAAVLASTAAGSQLQIAVGLEQHYPATLTCRKGIGIAASYPAGVKDLKGKVIESSAPASTDTADILLSLEASGLSLKDITLTYISGGPGDIIAALDAKRIDCGVLTEPASTDFGDQGEVVVDMESGRAPALVNSAPFTALEVAQSYAQKNPKIVADVQSAYVQATNLLSDPANAPKIAKAIAPEFKGLTVEQVTATLKALAPTFNNAANITPQKFSSTIKVYNDEAAAHVAGITKSLAGVPYKTWVLPVKG